MVLGCFLVPSTVSWFVCLVAVFLSVNLQIYIYGFHLSISCTPLVIQTMTNMTNWCQSNDLVGSPHLPGYFDKLMRVGGEGGLGMVWMEGGGLSPIAVSKSLHCTHHRHLLYTFQTDCNISQMQINSVHVCAQLKSDICAVDRYPRVNRALCQENLEMRHH